MTVIHANHIEEKLPINSVVPSRNEITLRLSDLFPMLKHKEALGSFITQCAEETERMILETELKLIDQNTVGVKLINRRSDTRHYCPKCQTQKIYYTSNYCPHCGVKIKFI